MFVVSDADAAAIRAIFQERGVEADQRSGLGADELKAVIGAYDGIAIRSATKVDRELISSAKNLKVIGRAGA